MSKGEKMNILPSLQRHRERPPKFSVRAGLALPRAVPDGVPWVAQL